MPAIGMRKSVVDGLDRQTKAALWGVLGTLHLGVPAVYSDGTNEWYVYNDSRISRDDLSWLGALTANISDIPASYHVPILPSLRVDIDTLRSEARIFLRAKRVAPRVYADDEEQAANVWQEVLTDNGAPVAIRAAESVPESWTRVED